MTEQTLRPVCPSSLQAGVLVILRGSDNTSTTLVMLLVSVTLKIKNIAMIKECIPLETQGFEDFHLHLLESALWFFCVCHSNSFSVMDVQQNVM